MSDGPWVKLVISDTTLTQRITTVDILIVIMETDHIGI